MRKTCVVAVDLVDVWASPGRKTLMRTLAWGDEVVITKESASQLEVETVYFNEQPDGSILPTKVKGYIEPRVSSKLKATSLVKPKAQNDVLKVNFVDVQQGDGSVIEAPDGTVILVDGGDNQLFARYLAGRFRGTSLAKPKKIDCILVTHGDADHFVGLPEIQASETNTEARKRLFIAPKRIYHNGLVKRPGTVNGRKTKDLDLLGPTKVVDGQTYLTGLESNLLAVPDAELNEPFLKWKATLATYNARSKLTFRRLQFGDTEAFKFFNTDDLRIEVLGPLVTTLSGKPALPFLGDPPKGPRLGHESIDVDNTPFKGHSASHTINGHSVVFRLTYGGYSYLFAGDLNDQASRFLTREHNAGRVNLRSEVFKVPHHGSADFSGAMFQAVSPVVSVVSSGDEPRKVHPSGHVDEGAGQVVARAGAADLRDRAGGVLWRRGLLEAGPSEDRRSRRRAASSSASAVRVRPGQDPHKRPAPVRPPPTATSPQRRATPTSSTVRACGARAGGPRLTL
ncbi:MAG: MBL fold metallo-hydrolase [Vicinamibacterales bacterium]